MSVARSGRFAGERDPAFVRLNSSLSLDWRLWREDIEGSVAHAGALRRAGVLTGDELNAVEDGLRAVAAEIEGGAFVPADEDEDVHMAIERRLTELAGEAGAKLHTGRSRTEHVLPAYTHLQRAQVSSLAQHLLAYFWMLARDRDRLARSRAACLELPLGSGAAVGVNYDLDRGAVACTLGFERVAANSIDAVADRDFVLDYLYAAAALGAHLSRLGAELVLWSSAEFGFVRLPDAFSGGSSIMPQKRNPDAAELMRAAAPRLAAGLQGLLGVLHGLPLAYNTDLREDKRYLFDAVDCLDDLLPVVEGLLAGVEFCLDRMAAACESALLATDVADLLVGTGLPFREAHHLVGRLVRLADERGVDLFDLPVAELRALSPAFGAAFVALRDPLVSLRAKRSAGGSAPERVREQLAQARTLLAQSVPAAL